MNSTKPASPLAARPHRDVSPAMVATTLELSGFRSLRSIGMVRGLGMQKTSLVRRLATHVRGVFGGGLSHRAETREQARKQAHARMMKHAAALGANAIVGVRYEVGEIDGAIEVLCYGTAIVAAPGDTRDVAA